MTSLRRGCRAWSKGFLEARSRHPYTLAFGLILPLPGILAVIFGDDVSRALSNLVADDLSRGMGGALLLGGLLVLFGVLRREPLVEVSGLVITAVGCAIYGLGVVLGLGLAGMVAGPGFLAIALGTAFRVMNFTAVTRTAHRPRHRR